MGTDFRGIPGVATGSSLTSRNIFTNNTPFQAQYVPSFKFIDGGLSRDTGETPTDLLRAGLILGKVTTGGKYRNSIIGTLDGAITATTYTSLTVPAAVATEVARLIALAGGNVSLKLNGPPSAAGTIASTSITATAASGTTLTISSVSLPAYVDKSIIQPADGSQTPVTVLPNPFGISVRDTAANNIDQPLALFLRGGDLIASQILAGGSAITDLDTSIQTWIKQQLNGGGTSTRGNFTFDTDR